MIKHRNQTASATTRTVVGWIFASFLFCSPWLAVAQGKKTSKPGPARKAEPAETSPRAPKNSGRKPAGGRDVIMEDGRKVKAYSFGTVDLEGKLKTPQLLYFLNRVRVELDSTTQQRRSFIPELKHTAVEKGL